MTYVLAVSGGVDSIVLLDALVNHRIDELVSEGLTIDLSGQFVVAHFDHGIRSDSIEDRVAVEKLAKSYNIPFETKRVELSADVSEDEARTVRYNFLRQVCKKHNAQLATAHHQDDLIETMIINLIRGTGWRGLVSLSSNSDILRPFLHTPKNDLLLYAKKYNLQWREDSTNSDTKYLRNYVRLNLIPAMLKKDPRCVERLLDINKETERLKKDIATELQNLMSSIQLPDSSQTFPRYNFIMWPPLASREVIYSIFTVLDPAWHPRELHIKRTLHFIKTGGSGKELQVSKDLNVRLSVNRVSF